MTKERFIAELRRSLRRMADGEKAEIVYDYEEHFRIGASEGRSEEQIAAALGSPRALGASYTIDSLLETDEEGKAPTAGSVIRAVFASIGLTFFNAIVVLGPFIALVAVMIALWAVALSLALSGVAVFLSPIGALVVPSALTTGGLNPALLVFAGIALMGFGVLDGIGMWQLSRLFVKATAAYVRFNARLVARRASRDAQKQGE